MCLIIDFMYHYEKRTQLPDPPVLTEEIETNIFFCKTDAVWKAVIKADTYTNLMLKLGFDIDPEHISFIGDSENSDENFYDEVCEEV